MDGWIVLFALVTIGLLIALVVLGALMYSKMSEMCCTSEDLAANAKETQSKMEAANTKLGQILAPIAPLIPLAVATAAASAAAAQQPPPPPASDPPPEPQSTD